MIRVRVVLERDDAQFSEKQHKSVVERTYSEAVSAEQIKTDMVEPALEAYRR